MDSDLLCLPGKPILSQCNFLPAFFLKVTFLKLYLLILERQRKRERERGTSICCSTYVRIRWLLLVCALTKDQTHNLRA